MIPLLTAGVPWALLMPWLVSSPLNSPNTFFLIAGALGYPMAIAQIVAAISMGVASGWITSLLESKGYLLTQLRNSSPKKLEGSSRNPLLPAPEGEPALNSSPKTETKGLWWVFLHSLTKMGTRRLVRQLALFIFVASAIKILIPVTWVTLLFGQDHWYSIPLAALIGIPLYVSNSSSVPIAKTLVESGMGSGTALAFILAGAGTSLPAMTGLLVIARVRIVALYVSLIFLGAVVFGFFYSLISQ